MRTTDNIGVITDPANFTSKRFGRWGLAVAPALADEQAGPGGITDVSWERIHSLDADVILLGYVSEELREKLESSKLFRALPR